MRVRKATIGNACPQYGVHLCHVRAPQHKGIRRLHIVVTPHGLIDPKGAHKPNHCAGHTMARIRVDIVGKKSRFVEFCRRIAFPHCPLARPKHANPFGAFFLQRDFELFFHYVKGFIPTYRLKLTVLIILSVGFTQQRRG